MKDWEKKILGLFVIGDEWKTQTEIRRLLRDTLMTRTRKPIKRTQAKRYLDKMVRDEYLKTKKDGRHTLYRPIKPLITSFSVETWLDQFSQRSREKGYIIGDDKFFADPFILTVYGLNQKELIHPEEELLNEARKKFWEGAHLLDEVFKRTYARRNNKVYEDDIKCVLDRSEEPIHKLVDPYSSEDAFAVLVVPSPSVLKEYGRNLENEILLFEHSEEIWNRSDKDNNKIERLASWLHTYYTSSLKEADFRKEMVKLREITSLGISQAQRHELIELLFQKRKEEKDWNSCLDDNRYLTFKELLYQEIKKGNRTIKFRDFMQYFIQELEKRSMYKKISPRTLSRYYRNIGFVKGKNIIRTEKGIILQIDEKVERSLINNL